MKIALWTKYYGVQTIKFYLLILIDSIFVCFSKVSTANEIKIQPIFNNLFSNLLWTELKLYRRQKKLKKIKKITTSALYENKEVLK